MPELIQRSMDKNAVELTAPYGDEQVTLRLRGFMPWWVLAPFFEEIQILAKDNGLELDDYSNWPLEKQMEVVERFIVKAGLGWDITFKGDPVALTFESFSELPELSKMTLLTKAQPYLIKAFASAAGSADAARKSGGRNLPVLKHGKGRTARRKSKGRATAGMVVSPKSRQGTRGG